MNQIRTYSKTRPKSFISSKDEDSIFQSHDKENESIYNIDDESDEDLNFQKQRKNSLVGERKMRPVKDNKSCQKKLKSLSKIGHHKTTPLKRKPTDTAQSPQKRTTKHSKSKKKKQQSENTSYVKNSQSQGKGKIFSWSGSNESKDSEPSIEILRKDEGMTWQQKISFLLPKMHQEYANENSITGKISIGKLSPPLLDISAEEVCEPVSEEDEDYTYTWVTETATQSKSNVGQTSGPSTNVVSGFSKPSTTLVAVDNSKTSSQRRMSDSTGGRTGKLKLSVSKPLKPTVVPQPSPNEFLDKDGQDASLNQKWNSTIHKNAKNIKDYGFPDVSSIRMTQNLSKKSSVQQRLETTPNKTQTVKTPSTPRKQKITEKQLQSTKMFLSDHIAFVDMVPEMSTIKKEKSDESIEMTRDKSFIKITKAESPITPYISPKQTDQEQVFTSTPTKDKDHKGKEFPEFDLSSVQIPEFDEDELEIHESRVVNSQEIVCEPTDEELEVADPVNVEHIPHRKEVPDTERYALNYDEENNNGIKSTKVSQNNTIKPIEEENIDRLRIDLSPIENVTVIPISKSPVHSQKSKSKVSNGKRNYDLKECCIAAIRVPVKPIRKSETHIDYQQILKNTPIDCMQQIFWT